MMTIPSLPWPHDDLERQHLLHGLTRLGLAEIVRVDSELRYRLLPYQPASTQGYVTATKVENEAPGVTS